MLTLVRRETRDGRQSCSCFMLTLWFLFSIYRQYSAWPSKGMNSECMYGTVSTLHSFGSDELSKGKHKQAATPFPLGLGHGACTPF